MYLLAVLFVALTHASPHHGATLCENSDGSGNCCHVLPGEYPLPYIDNHNCPGSYKTSYIFIDYGCSVQLDEPEVRFGGFMSSFVLREAWTADLKVPGANLPNSKQNSGEYFIDTNEQWEDNAVTSFKVSCDWIPQNCDWNMKYLEGDFIKRVYLNNERECRQECKNENYCKYWNWNWNDASCVLLKSARPTITASTSNSYPLGTWWQRNVKDAPGYSSGTEDCEFICEEGLGFFSATKISTHYTLGLSPNNAEDCREECRNEASCHYWDWDVVYGCNLRNNAGPGGLMSSDPSNPYDILDAEHLLLREAGHENCEFRGSRDAFTIVFVSDLENNYRKHVAAGSRAILRSIIEIDDRNVDATYDWLYDDKNIDPKLVIHGGDINGDHWMMEQNGLCWNDCLKVSVNEEFDDVWEVLYDAGIPMISSYGNHDWRKASENNFDHGSNMKTLDFVRQSYERSDDLSDDLSYLFEYTPFNPPGGETGPSNYLVDFHGVQIAMFQGYAFDAAYDTSTKNEVPGSGQKRFNELKDYIDVNNLRDRTTLVVAHTKPGLFYRSDPSGESLMKDFVTDFDKQPAFLAGHTHVERHKSRERNGKSFIEHTAPYPNEWTSDGHSHCCGAFAILVSPADGILQVKTFAVDPGYENYNPRLQDGPFG